MEQVIRRKIESLEAQLRKGPSQTRSKAASELARLGWQTRKSIRPRGRLTEAAKTRFPDPRISKLINRCILSKHSGVRLAAMAAAGEWGDESSARILAQVLNTAQVAPLRRGAAAALRTIGGPIATGALLRAVEHDADNEVRFAALTGLEELASQELTSEGEIGGLDRYISRPVLTRESLLQRSEPADISPHWSQKPTVRKIVETLEKVRRDASKSEFIRQKVDDLLLHFVK